MEIPLLQEMPPQQFTIVNMGRFVTKKLVQLAKLPVNAVLDGDNIIHPISTENCEKVGKSMLCSSSEIGTYDTCFFAVFQGSSNYTECHFTTFESEATCLSKILNDVVIISMVQPSIAHLDAHKNAEGKVPAMSLLQC